MEMEFKDPGRRRRVLLVMVGAVLAAAAGMGAFTLASKGTPVESVPTTSVLVASHDIPARTQLTPDDVALRQVPDDQVLTQAYLTAEEVIGRLSSVPIYADQQITPNLFATTSAERDFSILTPDEVVEPDSPYWRAVAIEIPANRAVGGEVKSGQHVDLVVSVEIEVLNQDANGNYVKCEAVSGSQFQCGTSTKLSFQDVEVLKAMPENDLYIFKVDLHQAEQISHVLQEAPGAFTMVLRPDEDNRPVDTSQYGTTTDRLIMTYLFPAPQLIDLSQLLGPSPYPYPESPSGPTTPGGSPVPGGSPNGSPEPGESPAPSSSPDVSAEPSASPSPAS